MFRLLIADITIGLLVGGALIWLGLYTLDVAGKAESDSARIGANAETQYQACLAGDAFRQADLNRWDQVLKLVDTMPSNPAAQRFVRGVDAANHLADSQATCNAP